MRDHAPDDLKAILTRQIHAIAYADAPAPEPPTLDELQAKYEAAVHCRDSRRRSFRTNSMNR